MRNFSQISRTLATVAFALACVIFVGAFIAEMASVLFPLLLGGAALFYCFSKIFGRWGRW